MSADKDGEAPKLTHIFIDEFLGVKCIRLDFDNDRHHASRPIIGTRDDIAYVLHSLAAQLMADGELAHRSAKKQGEE